MVESDVLLKDVQVRESPTHPTAEAIASLGKKAAQQAWEKMAKELLEAAAEKDFYAGLVPQAVTKERISVQAERLQKYYESVASEP